MEKSKIGGVIIMSPNMFRVESSNVAEVGYDENDKTVYVRFLNQSLYIYKGVPESEFENLKNAPSVGSYLHRNFKNVYPYERIE